MEIASISDIHSIGTGLISSSTFLVGLLHALPSYKGELVNLDELAREAVKAERNSYRTRREKKTNIWLHVAV